MIWLIIWIMLMMFWVFGGGYWYYNQPNPSPAGFGSGYLIPFLCLLIIGLVAFGILSPGPIQTTTTIVVPK